MQIANLSALICLIVIVAPMRLLAEEPLVFSGPQSGETLTSFTVRGVYDDLRGKDLDFVQMAGDKPFLLIFVHRSSRPSADLTRTLMHYGETRMEDGLFVAMVMLAQDLTDVERHMRQTISFWKNGPPAGISIDGEEGPGHYGLNRNMEMTVLVGRNKVVSANFPLIQPNVVDAPKILTEVNKFIGGEVPTVPELNMLRLHSRVVPSEIRLWQDGKPPQDPKLRKRICAVLHAGDNDQAVNAAAESVEAYVGTDVAKCKELGNVAQMLLAYRYGSSPPVAEAVPNQKEIYQRWADKHFVPEFPDVAERRR